jgi:hypothetical protein
MNYERQFASCEDDMPRSDVYLLGGVGGILYNPVCCLTSVPILAVPLYVLGKAFCTTNTRGRPWMFELKLYSITQLLLFYGNLHQHWTSRIGPPCIDTLGCVNNLILSAVVYRIYYYQNHNNNKPSTTRITIITPAMATTFLMVLSIFLLGIGWYDIQWESYLTIRTAPLVGLYVVRMMGKYSYQPLLYLPPKKKVEDKKDYYKANIESSNSSSRRERKLYNMALGLLVLVVTLTELERFLCPILTNNNNDFSIVVKRLYHSVLLHGIITSLFWCISELAFEVVQRVGL